MIINSINPQTSDTEILIIGVCGPWTRNLGHSAGYKKGFFRVSIRVSLRKILAVSGPGSSFLIKGFLIKGGGVY